MYSASKSRKSSVSFNVAFATDLHSLTTLLLKSIAAIDLVEKVPAPSVQASGFDDGEIIMKVGFWYASSHSSDSTPMDAVVRSIQSTLSEAGITPVTNQLVVEESPQLEKKPEDKPQPSAVSDQPKEKTSGGADAPTSDVKAPKSSANGQDPS